MISEERTIRKFVKVETYTSRSGIVMERDIYGIYLKEPEMDSYGNLVTPDTPLGFVSGNERPKGKLFTGKNRKERRAAMKKTQPDRC